MLVSVEFKYPGPYCNAMHDAPVCRADENLMAVEKHVDEMLNKSGYPFAHQYSWPDGSCYKYVDTGTDGKMKVYKKLRSLFTTEVKVKAIFKLPKDMQEEAGRRMDNKYLSMVQEKP